MRVINSNIKYSPSYFQNLKVSKRRYESDGWREFSKERHLCVMCWRLGTNFTYKSLQSICVCVFYKKRSAKNFFLHIITRDRNFSHVVFDRQYFDNNFDTTWRFNSLLFQKSLCINENKAVFLHTNSTGNKNTMTGLVNCKKTTRHHAHLLLGAKSRKTNDAKSRKWPKTSISAIFWRFRGQIPPNCKFSWKIGCIQIEGHI